MYGLKAVLWREYLFFKRRWLTITTGAMISPLLYLVAFGLGLGRSVSLNGISYLDYIVPGIIALSTMNVSFNAVSTPLIIARLYDKTLEEYLIAPIAIYSYAAGKILAGALRGLYAALIIIIISWLFRAHLIINGWFFSILFLNCLVFSSLGFLAALKIKSHPDMAKFNNYVITPMTFICGTFFSVDRIPVPFSYLIQLLPLTPASQGLRSITLGGEVSWLLLTIQIIYLLVFVFWGLRTCLKVE